MSPLKIKFENYDIYTTNGPGFILENILNQVEYLNMTAYNTSTPKYLNKIVNIINTEYKKLNLLGKYYSGTSTNIAVMDTNDLYVSFIR